jgi:anti-anti-sigma factor
MTQPTASHVQCPVVVLTITEEQVIGDQLLAVAVQSQARNAVLDFQRVKFLSSSGFRPLLSLHRLLRQQDGKLLLCGLSRDVREIFEVTRLISTKGSARAPFEVYPDAPAAVASLFQSHSSNGTADG